MGRATGFIRVLLVGIFLAARLTLGLPAAAEAHPAALHDAVLAHVEAGLAAVSPALGGPADDHCYPGHMLPCCYGPGLSGTALGVLPTAASLKPIALPSSPFAPGRSDAAAGIRGSPALPPPRV